MIPKKYGWLLMTTIVCFSLMTMAQTQITTGTIQGTVTDPQSALVTGASVEVKNTDTNYQRSLTTDSSGRFIALTLPPGKYTVTISKTGLGTVTLQDIDLLVGQLLTLTPQMKLAATKQSIEVTSMPDVDTSATESSTTLNERTVAQTPVLGRKFEDLLTLTPGVSIVQGPDGDEINFNGQRGIYNNISLDGGDYNNGFFGEQVGGQRASIDISTDAIKEFQVVAAGASAEFGRTAGGIVNVVTKSGTNELHGTLFGYYRGQNLSSNTSDGKPLKNFSREQFGGNIGGPIVKDKAFFFVNVEQIIANLQRDNLSTQLGPTACPTATPTIAANEALINSNTDCQRVALINFYKAAPYNQNEGLPVSRPNHNTSLLGKFDWLVTPRNQYNASFSYDRSRKVNETFDVPTYGSSANGTEGSSTIYVFNNNLVTTLSQNMVNEAHFSYSRENRPRAANTSTIKPDTGIGFGTTFRFGNPFFLAPGVDELFKRYQISDKLTWIHGKHNIKIGGEWLHSNNAQVFRGFFEGRYIFDSVNGFLRYAAPAAPGGFGPNAVECSNGTFVTAPTPCAGAATANGSPLLLFLQGAGLTGPATDAAGASNINNENFAIFGQDKWQVNRRLSVNYGLRWEAQVFPQMSIAPSATAYASFLSNPKFPSNGTLPSQYGLIQPRVGFAWDIAGNGKTVLRSSWGIYNANLNMLSQVGSITTNGVQQQTLAAGRFTGNPTNPTYPGLLTVSPLPGPCGAFPCFTGVRVFDKNYKNPRIYTTNVALEQSLGNNWVGYVEVTHSKGVHITNFLDYNRGDRGSPFGPKLGETMTTSSRAKSLYRGAVLGVRKSFSHHYQFDVNYTGSSDYDNDSNERDPFSDRSGPATPAVPFNLQQDYTHSDRDTRHKFNAIISGDMPWGFQGNLRVQMHSAQPTTVATRNDSRKDNSYSSVDWRVSRPFKVGERFEVIPQVELFNMFNSANNVNPLAAPALFNFDGFLRLGVGDPRQAQLSVKVRF